MTPLRRTEPDHDPDFQTGYSKVPVRLKGVREKCSLCKERNYITKKNRRNTPDRLELAKYCPRCHKSTAHRETR